MKIFKFFILFLLQITLSISSSNPAAAPITRTSFCGGPRNLTVISQSLLDGVLTGLTFYGNISNWDGFSIKFAVPNCVNLTLYTQCIFAINIDTSLSCNNASNTLTPLVPFKYYRIDLKQSCTKILLLFTSGLSYNMTTAELNYRGDCLSCNIFLPSFCGNLNLTNNFTKNNFTTGGIVTILTTGENIILPAIQKSFEANQQYGQVNTKRRDEDSGFSTEQNTIQNRGIETNRFDVSSTSIRSFEYTTSQQLKGGGGKTSENGGGKTIETRGGETIETGREETKHILRSSSYETSESRELPLELEGSRQLWLPGPEPELRTTQQRVEGQSLLRGFSETIFPTTLEEGSLLERGKAIPSELRESLHERPGSIESSNTRYELYESSKHGQSTRVQNPTAGGGELQDESKFGSEGQRNRYVKVSIGRSTERKDSANAGIGSIEEPTTSYLENLIPRWESNGTVSSKSINFSKGIVLAVMFSIPIFTIITIVLFFGLIYGLRVRLREIDSERQQPKRD